MANTMVKNYMHLIFHIKSTSVQMQQGDLPRIFAYIGGIIKELGGIPFIVGGMSDHVHLLITLLNHSPQKHDFGRFGENHKSKKQ